MGKEFSPSSCYPTLVAPSANDRMIDLGMLDRVRAGEERVDPVNVLSEHLRTQYYAVLNIFTDGSKDHKTGRTGAAFSVPEFKVAVTTRATDRLCVYAME